MARMKVKKALKKAKGRKSMADAVNADGVPTPDGTILPPTEPMLEKVDVKNDLTLEIESAGDGLSLKISVRAPLLAEVIRKMAPGNYQKDAYSESLRPILVLLEANKERVVTRPAIAKATKNFASTPTLNLEEAPPAAMLANPDALATGYSIVHKLDKPVPPDVLKRWGKQFMEGCADILTAARPFKFSWVMAQTPVYK